MARAGSDDCAESVDPLCGMGSPRGPELAGALIERGPEGPRPPPPDGIVPYGFFPLAGPSPFDAKGAPDRIDFGCDEHSSGVVISPGIFRCVCDAGYAGWVIDADGRTECFPVAAEVQSHVAEHGGWRPAPFLHEPVFGTVPPVWLSGERELTDVFGTTIACRGTNARAFIGLDGIGRCGCAHGRVGADVDGTGHSSCVDPEAVRREIRSEMGCLRRKADRDFHGPTVLLVLPAIAVALYLAIDRVRSRRVATVCYGVGYAIAAYALFRTVPWWVTSLIGGVMGLFALAAHFSAARSKPSAPMLAATPPPTHLAPVARPLRYGRSLRGYHVSYCMGLVTSGLVGDMALGMLLTLLLFVRAVLLAWARRRLTVLAIEAAALAGTALMFNGPMRAASLCVLAVLGIERLLPRRVRPNRVGAIVP